MNEILVDVGVNETQLAFLEDGELVEFYIERKNNRRIVGNIYKGRVINVLPGMQAAFVDIGLEKNSFLYVKDAAPQFMSEEELNSEKIQIKDLLKPGQEIVVQVIKEPIGTKGARVTTHITLPGRYLVLMPNIDYIGVSRRIMNEDERNRLRSEIEQIKPKNMGVIVRTVALGKSKESFNDDIKFLLKLWHKIEKEKIIGYAPRIIYKDFDLISKTIRDQLSHEINQLVINDKEQYDSAIELVELLSPKLKDRVKYYNEDVELFQSYKVDSQINKNTNRKIWLQSGGYLVIDSTEALTVIDVNTGKYVGTTDLEDTILKTNLEAAKEIGKQLRLRDIGGIIIVDFIDMIKESDENKVLKELEIALSKDKTKTKILGMTNLGLVEITRKKVRQRIESLIHKKCPYCDGSGRILCSYTILQKIEKEIHRLSIHTNSEAVLISVNQDTLEVIEKEKLVIEEIEDKEGIKLFFIADDKMHHNNFKVHAMGKLDKILSIIEENN
ncbi:Rne/Rng family ribonuclease [Serpentinicella alkaliphila]|uniref:Ribonuclease G n=1 Tax=Serpentinicella alkaliphila TaxID=1734049 RepID=A0A4R2TDI9_9FIRM|nr:Rne/Rng family ribonuclease [Serpentinicella alkaliphila]QUH26071.1 Rne/Rng family ribonuclease [Serpentinicella alkaliphila]TCP99084.1 RNAse G [Serpentinicella alkaliphila]